MPHARDRLCDPRRVDPDPVDHGRALGHAGRGEAGRAGVERPPQRLRQCRRGAALRAAPLFAQGGVTLRLETAADIALWHRLLPCAGRIVSISVKGDRATAVFVLANGKNRRCDAPGVKAAAVFRIRGGKIRSWEQVPVPPTGPTA